MSLILNPGDIFHSRYEIVSRLGEGGVGTVYLAIQQDSGREVAIKLLHADALESEKDRARFLREFKILAKLSHEHIIEFYSAALADEDIPYAVCEYIKGKHLLSLIQAEQKLSWERTWKIMEQVCAAMQYAHENGIVHRDLKPENIMLLDEPQADWVKVLDFGFAHVASPTQTMQRLTATGIIVGTVCYMSPEQCQSIKVDGRSDIYSLACIIYECLSGKLLFQAMNPLDVVRMHIKDDPSPAILGLRSQVPDELINVLLKALSKDRSARYKTMNEFSAALKGIIENPRRVSSKLAFRAKKNNSNLLIAGVSVVVLLMVSALIFLYVQGGAPEAGRAKAEKSYLDGLSSRQNPDALFAKGESLYKQGKFEEALPYLENAFKIKQERKQQKYKAAILVCRTYYALGKKDRAGFAAVDAMEAAKKQFGPSSKEYVEALRMRAISLSNEYKQESKAAVKEALQILSESQAPADLQLAELLSLYIRLLIDDRSVPNGPELADRELQNWKSAFDAPATPPFLLQSYSLLDALCAWKMNENARALKIADEAVAKLSKIEEASVGADRLFVIYTNWSDLYLHCSKPDKALACLKSAQKFFLGKGSFAEMQPYMTEAQILFEQGYYDLSLLVLKEGEKAASKLKSPEGALSELLFCTAKCYDKQGNKKQVIAYLDKAQPLNSSPEFTQKCARLRDLQK